MDKQKHLFPWCSLWAWRVGSWFVRSCTAMFSIATQEQGIKHGIKHSLFVVLEGWKFVLSSIHLLFALPCGWLGLTLKWDVTNDGKAKWEPSGLCANTQPQKGRRVEISFSFFTSFFPLPPICSAIKCCNVSQPLWQKLVPGNLCRVFVPLCAVQDLLKAAAWRGASEYTSTTLPWGSGVYLSLHTLKLSHFL